MSQNKLWKSSTPTILPKYFWKSMQILGIFPVKHTPDVDLAVSPKTDRCLLVYSLAILCLIAIYTVIRIGNYVDFYREQLKDLEFFTLLRLICYVSSQLQVLLILPILYFKAKYIPTLLHKLQSFSIWHSKVTNVRKLRWSRTVPILALLWTAATVAIPFAHIRYAMDQWNLFDKEFEYTADDAENPSQSNFFGLLKAPGLMWIIMDATHSALVLSITNASQMLTFVIILAVGKGFAHQVQKLREVDSTVEARQETWVFVRQNLAILLDSLEMCNNIFGWMNLIVCMQDLLNLILYIAIWLQQVVMERGDDEEIVYVRAIDRKILLVQTAGPFAVSLINLVLRFAVCSSCNGKGQTLASVAEQCSLESEDSHVQNQCRKIQQAIARGGSTAVSAGGFGYLTKEYLAALFGLVLTYVILIYQAMDAKKDLREFRNDVGYAVKNELKKFAIGNRSVIKY